MEKLALANVVCQWNTLVVLVENGPLYTYVDILLKTAILTTVVIYNINVKKKIKSAPQRFD